MIFFHETYTPRVVTVRETCVLKSPAKAEDQGTCNAVVCIVGSRGKQSVSYILGRHIRRCLFSIEAHLVVCLGIEGQGVDKATSIDRVRVS